MTVVTDLDAQIAAVFGKAPFVADLGMRVLQAAEGRVRTALDVEARMRQQHGFAHAGVVATLADHTAGAAASTVLEAGRSVLTADFNIHLLRPASGEMLVCEGQVVKAGRLLIVTQADVWDGDRHCARYTGTMAVVDRAI